jgi:hypothetical protein
LIIAIFGFPALIVLIGISSETEAILALYHQRPAGPANLVLNGAVYLTFLVAGPPAGRVTPRPP